jgi:cytochrome c-type biogenesis protein CcmF
MKAAIGFAAISVSASASLLGVVVLAAGLRRGRADLLRSGRRFVVVVMLGAVVAFVTMEWALFSHDFSIAYVADNVARATPGLYTFTALWGALQGSILLWGLVLSIYLTFTVWRFRTRATDPLVAWATLTGYVVSLFFFGLMMFAANPFELVQGAVPSDGAGPNALLQNHPLMAFHPPMLYAGYVGFTIPFTFAVAALVTGRFGEGWLADVRRTTLIAWGFLTVGIVLGAWWSYEVLGWGGYWAWDPVENASLLPWLTGTAFIHSVIVQERRGMLRVWNLSLVIATFCLTILGTFLTRSGVIDSVHSFSRSAIGPALLGFLGVVVVTGLALIAWRGDRLRTPGRIDSPVSRESAFLVNNVLFTGFALVVLTGTVFPLLVEAVQDRQLSVGEPYFDRMTVPIGIGLLFLMAVAPALPWRAASGELLRQRLLVPAWAGVVTVVGALFLGAHGIANVLAFGLAAFAIAGIVRQVYVGVRARRNAHAENPFVALVHMVRGNPRLYGGLVVHAGVVLVAVAIAVSAGYSTKRDVQLRRGESATVRGYTVTYVDRAISTTGQKTTVEAKIDVVRGGRDLGTYAPAISTFPNTNGGIGTPSVRTSWREDLYLTLISSPTTADRVTLGVAVNPMVLWLWIGGAVMGFGTLLALVPTRRRSAVRDTPPGSEPRTAPPAREVEEVAVG